MNQQQVIILPKTFNIGNNVRKVITKKIFDKGDLTTHSQKVYIITDVKNNKYQINDDTNRWYKPYELKNANEVEFDDDYNPEQPIPKAKPRKKKDVQEHNILEEREKRDKKKIDYKSLHSKGV
jgi:hypothetical protein